MAYTLPVFNIKFKVSDSTSAPQDIVWSGVTEFRCQKYAGPKVRDYSTAIGTTWRQQFVQIRFHPDDFYAVFDRLGLVSWSISIMLQSDPSGDYYRAVNWDIANFGFSNEYPFVTGFLCRGLDGMPVHPGSANNNGFPGGWPYGFGPIP